MSNPEKPAPPATKPDQAKTIPVKCLQFYQPHPKLDAAMSISAESRTGQRKVSIEFIPSIRHHRLEIQKPTEKLVKLLIWEGHVASVEPLD